MLRALQHAAPKLKAGFGASLLGGGAPKLNGLEAGAGAGAFVKAKGFAAAGAGSAGAGALGAAAGALLSSLATCAR